MSMTRSMTRNQKNHDDDDDASSSQERSKTFALWSDLDHNLLFLVMMKLGFVDYYSFRVCKSWRSIAHSNENMFMASRPPMAITSIYCRVHEKPCHLEDFDGRKLKTIIPHSAVAACVGLTCGYLIFFVKKTHSFWLVNPITRKELHFPDFPINHEPGRLLGRAILVFSPSLSGLVFVVLCGEEIWFSIAGKGAWNHVSCSFHISDIYMLSRGKYIL